MGNLDGNEYMCIVNEIYTITIKMTGHDAHKISGS